MSLMSPALWLEQPCEGRKVSRISLWGVQIVLLHAELSSNHALLLLGGGVKRKGWSDAGLAPLCLASPGRVAEKRWKAPFWLM